MVWSVEIGDIDKISDISDISDIGDIGKIGEKCIFYLKLCKRYFDVKDTLDTLIQKYGPNYFTGN